MLLLAATSAGAGFLGLRTWAGKGRFHRAQAMVSEMAQRDGARRTIFERQRGAQGRLARALEVAAVLLMLAFMPDDVTAQPSPPSPPFTQREEALHLALQQPDVAKVRALLDAGANVNARNVIGATALHVAVNFRGDLPVVRLLLDRGARVDARNDDGLTPLLLALRHAHYGHGDPQRLLAVAELLLARGASVKVVGEDGALPVRAAMDPVNIPLLRLLLEHGASLPDDGLDWALSNGYADLVRVMLERPTAAMLAYEDPSGGTMLHRAAEKPEMLFALEWLVRRGADIEATDDDGVTPFGRAAFHDNIPAMAFLHGRKARTNRTSTAGDTPLHLAAYGARHDVMRWLIERGAVREAKDKEGRTPLDIAIDTHRFAFYDDRRKEELVTLLGGNKRDILRGRYSNHPLHEATTNRDLKAVRRLLEGGADANVKNASGHTPLFWAIAWSSGLPATPAERAFGKELLPLLIRHGANPDMRMGDGSTERTYTQYARSLRIGDLLESTRKRYAPPARARGGSPDA